MTAAIPAVTSRRPERRVLPARRLTSRRARATKHTVTPDAVREAAVEAAREAGALALRYFAGSFEVSVKADRTPVTQADREAEEAIVARLAAAFPDIGFLGEEFGARGPQARRWIVDPIDGTKNFVRGIPYWATLVALEEAGEVTLGVVHAPATGDLLWAQRGRGAFANGRPLRVSAVDDLAVATLLHSSLGDFLSGPHWAGLRRLAEHAERTRAFGDYFGYTFVLRGQAELMVEAGLKPWDLAPFAILFAEAGGRLTDFAGQPTIYSGSALATNGRVHAAALALLRGSGL
jgi:histidinol-phosphatase